MQLRWFYPSRRLGRWDFKIELLSNAHICFQFCCHQDPSQRLAPGVREVKDAQFICRAKSVIVMPCGRVRSNVVCVPRQHITCLYSRNV